MAIAFDAASNGTSGAAASISWNHTCSGSDRIIFVDVLVVGASESISGVTYNGVAMTQVNKVALGTNWKYLYYLVAPATGANTVQVSGSDTSFKSGCSASYTGVDQSSPIDNNSTHSESDGTPYAHTLASIADNCWHLMGVAGVGAALTCSDTERAASAAGYAKIADKNSAKTPAGNVTLTYTHADTQSISSVMASFKPAASAAGAASPQPNLLLMGVG